MKLTTLCLLNGTLPAIGASRVASGPAKNGKDASFVDRVVHGVSTMIRRPTMTMSPDFAWTNTGSSQVNTSRSRRTMALCEYSALPRSKS